MLESIKCLVQKKLTWNSGAAQTRTDLYNFEVIIRYTSVPSLHVLHDYMLHELYAAHFISPILGKSRSHTFDDIFAHSKRL